MTRIAVVSHKLTFWREDTLDNYEGRLVCVKTAHRPLWKLKLKCGHLVTTNRSRMARGQKVALRSYICPECP